MDQQYPYYAEISEWLRFQPLSILQLDACDRVSLFSYSLCNFNINNILLLI